MDYHKAHGRRKAGTWGKPHKKLRTDANQATRTLLKKETYEEVLIKTEEIEEDNMNDYFDYINRTEN